MFRHRGLQGKLLVLLTALVLFVGAWIPAAADDRRTDPSALVVMTLNGEFMWDVRLTS